MDTFVQYWTLDMYVKKDYCRTGLIQVKSFMFLKSARLRV